MIQKRLTILDYLKSGEKCACVLIENMNIGQSALSYHMKILCDSGIVHARQEGKWTHYSLSKSGSEYASKRIARINNAKYWKSIKLLQIKSHRKVAFIKLYHIKNIWYVVWRRTFLEVVNSIWSFFQDQILGMKWLNGLIGKGLSQLGLDIDSRLGGSIQFFLLWRN